MLLTGLLIIPIRGGVQEISLNQSNVYFSKNMFANHAAVNSLWNFSHSFSHKIEKTNPYINFDPQFAESIINKRRNNLLDNNYKILKTNNPNVILII